MVSKNYKKLNLIHLCCFCR